MPPLDHSSRSPSRSCLLADPRSSWSGPGLFRLRPGHRRADGEAPRRAARLPGVSLRPDLHARGRGVAGGAAVRGFRRVAGRAEDAAAGDELVSRAAGPDVRARDGPADRAAAVLASLPFVLPPAARRPPSSIRAAAASSRSSTSLLIWVTRHRPLLCGLVFGIGFLNREFTIYGWRRSLCLEALDDGCSRARARAAFARMPVSRRSCGSSVQGLKTMSSASGPGTTANDTFTGLEQPRGTRGAHVHLPGRDARPASGVCSRCTGPRSWARRRIRWRRSRSRAASTQGLAGSSWLPAASCCWPRRGHRAGARGAIRRAAGSAAIRASTSCSASLFRSPAISSGAAAR